MVAWDRDAHRGELARHVWPVHSNQCVDLYMMCSSSTICQYASDSNVVSYNMLLIQNYE